MTKVAHIEMHRPANVLARPEPELSLVPVPAPGQRARELFAEARMISREHLGALQAAIVRAHDLAREVVDAGDLYPVGLQDFAGRLAEELFWRAKTLEALSERQNAAAHSRRGSRAS
jgi:hypothetical protein